MENMMRKRILSALSTITLLIYPLSLSASTAPSPDFNGDGKVGIADFLLFVDQFGNRQGDGKYEAKYDLDGDGLIGIGDFLIFVNDFGKEVPPSDGGDEEIVDIPDASLRAIIAYSLGKARGATITRAEMASLTVLEAQKLNISDLKGLEFATNLISLDLNSNSITDLSPLSNLTNLTSLNLDNNSFSDIAPSLSNLTNLTSLSLVNSSISEVAPLSNLTNLTFLSLVANPISDLSPLSNLTNLTSLWLFHCTITDLSPLSNLTSLRELQLGNSIFPISIYNNSITDISALSGLTSLTTLGLEANSITDLAPLVENTGLGEGDRVFVNNNPLSATSINKYIPALQSRGVDVRFGASKPAVEENRARHDI